MSYNHLRATGYRQRPSSMVSAENLESNSDQINKATVVGPSTSSTPTAVLFKTKSSKLSLLPARPQRKDAAPPAKDQIFIDYCAYHDVAVSRVTCL